MAHDVLRAIADRSIVDRLDRERMLAALSSDMAAISFAIEVGS